jgi:hypothetical protein
MSSITKDRALAALYAAQDLERLEAGELADRFMACLRRQRLFRNIPIAEFDLATADALRELEHDLGEYGWRLAQQFKREIDFHDEQPECEREEWIDWPADDNGMTIEETANGWVVVKDNADFGGQLFETEEKAARWIDAYLEQRERRTCALRPEQIPFDEIPEQSGNRGGRRSRQST